MYVIELINEVCTKCSIKALVNRGKSRENRDELFKSDPKVTVNSFDRHDWFRANSRTVH